MSLHSDSIIKINRLAKTYHSRTGDEVPAIGDITFDVREGEFITLVGPSGCGKSTLLKIIAGLLPRTGGTIQIRGTEVSGPTRQIGMIFQNPVLLPWKTVFQNVMVPIHVLGLNPDLYLNRARDLISLVGLQGFENSYPFELSGGMAQRNAIVRALVHDPEILLADEPFGALDAMTREQMNIEIQRIWMQSRKTVLFVTHSIPEAVFLADTVVVLSQRPSQVIDLVHVDFPRPRSIEIMGTDRFGSHLKRVRAHFSKETGEPRPPLGSLD
jgi:NitT/TauT family transport system ATP-binding protein